MASLSPAEINDGIVTASKAANGDLRVDTWRGRRTGNPPELGFEHRDTATAGAINAVSVAPIAHGRVQGEADAFQGAVVGVRDGQGKLKVIAYEINASLELTRRGTSKAVRFKTYH